VAQRVAAAPGKKDYGILSVLVQAYYSVEYNFEVGEDAFDPPPKVKSAVIRLLDAGNPFGITDDRRFRILVKAAFSQRRKQLRNPLRALFPSHVLADPLFTRRAEQLSVREYVDLIPLMS
jgi:16S rRNA (adenine1518-N6/adenine1519-N6)-dimethyltransferase